MYLHSKWYPANLHLSVNISKCTKKRQKNRLFAYKGNALTILLSLLSTDGEMQCYVGNQTRRLKTLFPDLKYAGAFESVKNVNQMNRLLSVLNK